MADAPAAVTSAPETDGTPAAEAPTPGADFAARKAAGTASFAELSADFLAKRRGETASAGEPAPATPPATPPTPPAHLAKLPDVLTGTAPAAESAASPTAISSPTTSPAPSSEIAELRAELAQMRAAMGQGSPLPAAALPPAPAPAPATTDKARSGEPAATFREAAQTALGEHALPHEVDAHVEDMQQWAHYQMHVGSEAVDQGKLTAALEEIRTRYTRRAQAVQERAGYEARLTQLEERTKEPADRQAEQASLNETAAQLGAMLSNPDATLQEYFPTLASLGGHHEGLVQPLIDAAITEARSVAGPGDEQQWTAALGNALKGMEVLLGQQIPVLRAARGNGTYAEVLAALTTLANGSPYAGVITAVDGWFQQQPAPNPTAEGAPAPRAPWPTGRGTETPTRTPLPTSRIAAAKMQDSEIAAAAREYAARRRSDPKT